MLKYKGYHGVVEYDDEAGILHGDVLDIRDVITFQGKSVDEIETAFRDSVDDYLAMCAENGVEPNKPFSGHFVTRVTPQLHGDISRIARLSDKSLNTWVAETLAEAVAKADAERKKRPKSAAKSKAPSAARRKAKPKKTSG
jgi:predicted HicB family RNase H-like nuclease